MKKLAVVFFALLLAFASVAMADEKIDLQGMTFDELVALKDQINLAIWNSQEWQEVTVPVGVWIGGEDIPVGHWTVRCADPWRATVISWGEALDETGEDISFDWDSVYSWHTYVYNPNHEFYTLGDGITEHSFQVREGYYIVIDDGAAVFSPYAGKPSLGFK